MTKKAPIPEKMICKNLIENMQDGFSFHEIVMKDKKAVDYIFLEVNKAFEKQTGLKRKDIIGKTVTEVLPGIEKDHADWIGKYTEVALDNKILRFKQFSEKLNKWYSVTAYSPEKYKFVTLFHDITDQKLQEQKITESEERYNLAMKATNDGIYDWNLVTNEIYYSPSWKNMLGYKDHELPNDFSVWEKLTEKEDVKKSWEKLNAHIEGRLDKFEMEFKMKHKDGHWVDVLSRAEAVFNEEGKAIRVIGTHVDITERKKTLQKLKESEEKFRVLAAASPSGIYLSDKNGNCTYSNPFWLKMTGMKLEECLGDGWLNAIHPDDRSFISDSWKKMIKKNGDWALEYRFIDKKGNVTWVYGIASKILIEEGGIAGYIGVNIDITAKKIAEEELKNHQEHLEELVKERTRELEKKNIELERFNKLFVGREFRIKELKEEVERLKRM